MSKTNQLDLSERIKNPGSSNAVNLPFVFKPLTKKSENDLTFQ